MKIKLLYPPRLYGNLDIPYPANESYATLHPHIVPYSLPFTLGYFRYHGYKIDQDDLDIRHFRLWWEQSQNASDLSPFLEEGAIKKAVEGKGEVIEDVEKFLDMTRFRGYDVIGFSLIDEMNLGAIGSILVLARLLKEKYDPFIILGGTMAFSHLSRKHFEASPHLDAVITGNQYNFHRFLEHLEEDGREFKPEADDIVKEASINRFHRRNRWNPFARWKSRSASDREQSLDWKDHGLEDNLPRPVYDGLPLDLYRYRLRSVDRKETLLTLPYKFQQGCSGNCTFCYLSGRKTQILKSPEKIADDLEYLSRKHRTSSFFFLNAMCNPTLPFAQEMCNAFIERDLQLAWSDCARFSTLDKETLHLLKEAGAKRLIFGLESASDRMLAYIQKGTTSAQAAKILKLSHDLGIWNELEIISGLPNERPEDLQATADFLTKNKESIDYYYLNSYYMTQPSLLFLYPEKFGLENVRLDEFGRGYAYDEIDGLPWEESVIERKKSYEVLKKLREEKFKLFGYRDDAESFLRLIYLLTSFDDKDLVKEYLSQEDWSYPPSSWARRDAHVEERQKLDQEFGIQYH